MVVVANNMNTWIRFTIEVCVPRNAVLHMLFPAHNM